MQQILQLILTFLDIKRLLSDSKTKTQQIQGFASKHPISIKSSNNKHYNKTITKISLSANRQRKINLYKKR